MKRAERLKSEILEKVAQYYRENFGNEPQFIPGETRIPYAGRVFNEKELINLVDSSLEFWLTHNRYSIEFEKGLCEYLGIRHCHFVNSGSSANLLAFMALTSDKLAHRKIDRGDEIITVAAGFPTTVAPIIQYGAVPVFVDITIPTYNVDCSQLERAVSSRTKAVMLAHTLGNPFDVERVKSFCLKHDLWLIEDNCDSLGSRYDNQLTGTFGDLGTSSFYPAHHITTGEGGAVYTSNDTLSKILLSLRDWGRDCYCPSGKDNTCGNRFSQKFGDLPPGYDHKYVYSHFGYNLKASDMQAAIGCSQLEKIDSFTSARKKNWKLLKEGIKHLENVFILPEASCKSDPSWFGFLLTVREEAGFTRDEIVRFLESKGIQTRMLFAGNLLKHPCFTGVRTENKSYRVAGDLTNTDIVMKNTFWLGVYPGLTGEMISYFIDTINSFKKS